MNKENLNEIKEEIVEEAKKQPRTFAFCGSVVISAIIVEIMLLLYGEGTAYDLAEGIAQFVVLLFSTVVVGVVVERIYKRFIKGR